MEEHNDATKVERPNPYLFSISKVINKFLDILTNDFHTILPPNKNLDHMIEVHQKSISPTKTLCGLNQKKKKNLNDKLMTSWKEITFV
jgi:hypothetical protein